MRANRIILLLSVILTLSSVMAMTAERLPKPEKFVLNNGLTVYFFRNPELPLVSFRMLIPGAGTAFEPEGFDGLASLTAELLQKGTKTMSAEEIAEALDFLGARFTISDSEEYATVYGECLSEHLPRLLQITSDCLTAPAFKEEEYQKELSRKKDSLKAIKDNPGSALRQYFRKAYFGNHPFGHLSAGTDSSLNRLTLSEVKKFYATRYRPDVAILAVVGDVEKDRLLQVLKSTLGKWSRPSAPAPATTLPDLPVPRGKKLVFVDKPDATQCYFALGSPGYPVGDKITPVAAVMNTLWGGRFTSWLNTELRIKRGLTYGASSSFQSWKNGGLFMASSYTKNDKIGEMLDITFELLKKAKEKGFSAEETESARNYLLGQFPQRLETNGAKANAYLQVIYYGLGFDYYDRYLNEINAVKPEALKSAAERLLPEKDFVLVVVGKGSEALKLLEKYGQFEVKKITDPDF
ncbi:MAG: M16 family metallopeptidase [Candidatus Saccharicenans sp.]